MNILNFIDDVINKNRDRLPSYFHNDATIRWHSSNEEFNVQEFIKINCDYPGNWDKEIERIETNNDLHIIAMKVFSTINDESYHVVSFIELKDGLISTLDEYWSIDEKAPQWRAKMHIGKPIK